MTACTAARHGTISAYWRWRCKCPEAREARRLYDKRRREGRQPSAFIDSTGTVRRIHALQAIGWSQANIGARLGASQEAVSLLVNRTCVTRAKAVQVAALYDELCMIPGPAAQARASAQRRGYPPPLAWDNIDTDPGPVVAVAGPRRSWVDWVAVDRCAHGLLPASELTAAEHDAVVRRLHAEGLNDCQIADRAELVPRSVLRIRQRLGLPAARGWTQNRGAA